ERALAAGALDAVVVDARDEYADRYLLPTLQANARYQGKYPLVSALSRPLICDHLVRAARKFGARYVAHGCTGKGNDQVRFDVATGALAPDLTVVAPVREWGMTREQEIEYAREHGVEVPATVESPYSTDVNLWGRSIEAGILEDPWEEPPAEVFAWTTDPDKAPARAAYVEVKFEAGVPVALDGEALDPLPIVERLNALGGEHGVGRIDMVENRLVGIKSREIYEAPAAVILVAAHAALEDMTLSKDVLRFKQKVAAEWSDLTYNGLWFSSLRHDLYGFVSSTQEHVNGEVRLKLYRGNATVVGRKAPEALYQKELATYGAGDTFDQGAAAGFIHLWGLPLRTQARVQGVLGDGGQRSLLPADVKRLVAGEKKPDA
ncbi:MAG TPA: argininosuccinate synthase, partial [Candidatus Dormibacteraeota bacterium]|nr:argininosuccinate synthase [Candidatus Dormibacteraeota bacterium]